MKKIIMCLMCLLVVCICVGCGNGMSKEEIAKENEKIESVYNQIEKKKENIGTMRAISIVNKGMYKSQCDIIQSNCNEINELYNTIKDSKLTDNELLLKCKRSCMYYKRVSEMVEDGVFDDEEGNEYLNILRCSTEGYDFDIEIQNELDNKYNVK